MPERVFFGFIKLIEILKQINDLLKLNAILRMSFCRRNYLALLSLCETKQKFNRLKYVLCAMFNENKRKTQQRRWNDKVMYELKKVLCNTKWTSSGKLREHTIKSYQTHFHYSKDLNCAHMLLPNTYTYTEIEREREWRTHNVTHTFEKAGNMLLLFIFTMNESFSFPSL